MAHKQIDYYLPPEKYGEIHIDECFEEMVKVSNCEKVVLEKEKYKDYNLVRRTVFYKLVEASLKLPEGMKIKFLEGYRPVSVQKEYWDKAVSYFKEKYPDLSLEGQECEANKLVARPNKLANHNCGGAIDVVLCDDRGYEVDMGGCHIVDGIPANYKKLAMFSDLISGKQAENRKILREVMESVGFVWYPLEFWHFCINDRMWAVYTDRECCSYGPVDDLNNAVSKYMPVAEGEPGPDDFVLPIEHKIAFDEFDLWIESSKDNQKEWD